MTSITVHDRTLTQMNLLKYKMKADSMNHLLLALRNIIYKFNLFEELKMELIE